MVRWPQGVEKPYSIAPGFATISEICHIRHFPNDDIYDIITTLFGILREVMPARNVDGKPDLNSNSHQLNALIDNVMREFITGTFPSGLVSDMCN